MEFYYSSDDEEALIDYEDYQYTPHTNPSAVKHLWKEHFQRPVKARNTEVTKAFNGKCDLYQFMFPELTRAEIITKVKEDLFLMKQSKTNHNALEPNNFKAKNKNPSKNKSKIVNSPKVSPKKSLKRKNDTKNLTSIQKGLNNVENEPALKSVLTKIGNEWVVTKSELGEKSKSINITDHIKQILAGNCTNIPFKVKNISVDLSKMEAMENPCSSVQPEETLNMKCKPEERKTIQLRFTKIPVKDPIKLVPITFVNEDDTKSSHGSKNPSEKEKKKLVLFKLVNV